MERRRLIRAGKLKPDTDLPPDWSLNGWPLDTVMNASDLMERSNYVSFPFGGSFMDQPEDFMSAVFMLMAVEDYQTAMEEENGGK